MYVKTHKDIEISAYKAGPLKKNKNKRSAVRLGRPANAPPITHSYSIPPTLHHYQPSTLHPLNHPKKPAPPASRLTPHALLVVRVRYACEVFVKESRG